jgi:hypothetical protein
MLMLWLFIYIYIIIFGKQQQYSETSSRELANKLETMTKTIFKCIEEEERLEINVNSNKAKLNSLESLVKSIIDIRAGEEVTDKHVAEGGFGNDVRGGLGYHHHPLDTSTTTHVNSSPHKDHEITNGGSAKYATTTTTRSGPTISVCDDGGRKQQQQQSFVMMESEEEKSRRKRYELAKKVLKS